ncbi:uncharacterized protein TNCV_2128221 [Trichonephila clavipes]|nr:uncharacterized protein TNCV_2128221 [Trichonephila clavipes]
MSSVGALSSVDRVHSYRAGGHHPYGHGSRSTRPGIVNGGHNVTVNGDRYRAMITNFFIPELNNHDVQELWFQQDGATCHTARATIDLLKDTFGDRLFSRFGPVNWPPRSCDLTPLDYFLWGYVKSLVYADKPQTLNHLEDNIHRVIADIRPQMLEKVIKNWTSRLDYIRASRGRSHVRWLGKIGQRPQLSPGESGLDPEARILVLDFPFPLLSQGAFSSIPISSVVVPYLRCACVANLNSINHALTCAGSCGEAMKRE